MPDKSRTIMVSFHNEPKKRTKKQIYKHLFTWKSDVMPKGKIIK